MDGPATIENSWIGENAIVGNLGPVTLKDTVVGPQTILGSGVAENAVFLGKETMINDFTTGFGFRVRKGSLYEEDSSSAQHTDTKMTVLFPGPLWEVILIFVMPDFWRHWTGTGLF